MLIERKGEGSAFVDQAGGGPIPQARLGITLDGYSAPLTAGNFAANVADGVYNGVRVNASYASVLAGAGAHPGACSPSCPICNGSFLCFFSSDLSPALMLMLQSAVPALGCHAEWLQYPCMHACCNSRAAHSAA
jgi:hypothetical protein